MNNILTNKIFTTGVKREVKQQYGIYTIKFSNCSREYVEKQMLKLYKIFDSVLLTSFIFGVYTIECRGIKE